MSARTSARPHHGQRGRRPLAAVLAGTLAVSGAAIIMGSAPASATPGPTPVCSATTATCTVTFDYSGSLDSFTVPAGVTSVDLDVYGAQGGQHQYGGGAGAGGRTTGTLAATPGQDLVLLVGQAGAQYAQTRYGGGGASGNGGASQFGSGGGGSFVFTSTGALVAAAGGGGGGAGSGAYGGAGAGAGSDAGGGAVWIGGAGGGAGTATAGGFGGYDWLYGTTAGSGGGPAGGNDPGQGGAGGNNNSYPQDGGAGGGGGYYGGGGGSPYNGGGGGSGYADSALADVTAQSGVRGGNGQVVISYDRSATDISLDASPNGGSTVGDEVTLTATVSSAAATPTGGVTFTDGGTTLCSAATVNGAGTATCTTSSLAPGPHSLAAAYAGDDTVAPSTSTASTYAVAYKPLRVTTTSLPSGTYGLDYSAQLEAADGHGSYTWSLTSGELPDGLTLSTDGLVSGTPQAAGTTNDLTFQAADAQDEPFTDTVTLDLTIDKAAQAVTFSPSSPEQGTVGQTWDVDASGYGTGVTSYAIGDETTGDACSVTGSTVSFDHVGTCEVVATQAADANYVSGSNSYSIGVEPKQTDVVVTTSDENIAYGHPVTASATSTAPGTIQWAVGDTDLGEPMTVTPGTPVDAPALYTELPTPGTYYEVSATFVPADPTVDDTTVGRGGFSVSQAEPELHLTVAADSLTATVENAVDGDGGVPTGDVTFLVDNVEVGTAPLGTPLATMVGTALTPVLGSSATLTYAVPAGSSHDVTAIYDGDDNFTGASDSTERDDPLLTAAATSSRPASNGWYRTPVTVRFTCTPVGALLVGPCPAPVVLARNGAGQSVSRTVLAQDGGSATASLTGINVDRTAPVVRVVGKGSSARCVATDSLSGVARCTLTRTKVGRRTRLAATAVDRAGNVATSSAVAAGPMRIKIRRAPHSQGRFTVHAGSTYTVVAWGRHRRPSLLSVVPMGRSPRATGQRFRGIGKGRWVASMTVPSGAVGAWKLGVRTATGPKAVRLWVLR